MDRVHESLKIDELVKRRRRAMGKGPQAKHYNAAYSTFYDAIKIKNPLP